MIENDDGDVRTSNKLLNFSVSEHENVAPMSENLRREFASFFSNRVSPGGDIPGTSGVVTPAELRKITFPRTAKAAKEKKAKKNDDSEYEVSSSGSSSSDEDVRPPPPTRRNTRQQTKKEPAKKASEKGQKG
jgi:hypothetical protein